MDRTRDGSAPRSGCAGTGSGGRGSFQLRRQPIAAAALLLGALVTACSQLEPDFDSVIALEVVVPDSGFMERGDTLYPRARALNGRGDSVEATVTWATLDTAILEVDGTTGAARGKATGTGRIQARVGNLPSNPIAVIVQPSLDSVRIQGDARDTVTRSPPAPAPPDSLSDSLIVRVFAMAPPGLSGAQTLVRRRVTYVRTVFPNEVPGVTLLPNDTAWTNTAGLAMVQLRLDAGSFPDSIKLEAFVVRHDGTAVPGSPLTFVVEYRP
jgi:hypothetical protein